MRANRKRIANEGRCPDLIRAGEEAKQRGQPVGAKSQKMTRKAEKLIPSNSR